jgi:micrococcal nuclease
MSMVNDLYTYKATVVRVLDGDTAELIIDLGFTVQWRSTCRFYGINTPELKSKDAEEKVKAIAAKEFTKANLNDGAIVIIKSKSLDKYGRPLVDIYCGKDNSIHLNASLIDNGLARPLKY